MTTEDNRDVIARYAAAWAAGDFQSLFALYADDFVLHYGGAHRLSGTHVGKDAALTAMGAFSAATGRQLVAVVDTMAGENRAAQIVRERMTTPEGAVEVERVFVYRIEGGLMRECWLYDRDQALIDALVGR
ncbi:MAG: nuclear transport factor 2 family protein [Micropepsaceae bacterium]